MISATGGQQRHQRREQGAAEDEHQDEQSGDHTDGHRQPGTGAHRAGDRLPAKGDALIGPVGRFGGLDQSLAVCFGHLRRDFVPCDPRERNRAITTDLGRAFLAVGTAHLLHTRHLRPLRQGGAHRGPDRSGPNSVPVRRLDHDLIALSGRRREVLGQQADRGLRIGVRQVEVGVELAATRLAQADNDDQRHQPAGEHHPVMRETKAGQSDHERHSRQLGVLV
jgi:hypothetical protein